MLSIPATRSLGRCAAATALAATALALAACSSSSPSSTPPAASSSPAAASAVASSGASASAPPKAMNIAYMSFAVDNTYDAPMLAAAQALCGDARDPALAALGARGLARVKKLVAGKPPKLVRDAMRCLKR